MNEISETEAEGQTFPTLALAAFAFTRDLGFLVAGQAPRCVRLQSATVFLDLYRGRRSSQVGLEMGRLRVDERFSLYEVLLAVAPGSTDLARCQAVERSVLRRCLNDVADTMRRQAVALLRGDPSAFEALETVVDPVRKSATLQYEFGAVLRRADLAWEAGDRSEAAELYASAEPALDVVRRRRMDYARRKNRR